ncbi:MAG: site-2 protease family protein [Bryobacterales bacterium]|jgi:Zn-dependent protease|nr:site-2 protease family protein [Bryobacterales bacterium]
MDTNTLINAAITVLLFVILVAPHEFAHAWVAKQLGDDTPVLQGRVTLNPLAHIDWVGTVILPAVASLLGGGIFGWGRPVLTNPAKLRGGSQGLLRVALAGPAMNVILAFPFAALSAYFLAVEQKEIAQFCLRGTYLTVFLAIFNMMPVPPLDGSKFLIAFNVPPAIFNEIARMGLLILILAMAFTPLGTWMSNISVTTALALVGLFVPR